MFGVPSVRVNPVSVQSLGVLVCDPALSEPPLSDPGTHSKVPRSEAISPFTAPDVRPDAKLNVKKPAATESSPTVAAGVVPLNVSVQTVITSVTIDFAGIVIAAVAPAYVTEALILF